MLLSQTGNKIDNTKVYGFVAGSMDMSVSRLVAKSVTGMVTFGSSGSGEQFTMEEVTLELVVNDIGIPDGQECIPDVQE